MTKETKEFWSELSKHTLLYALAIGTGVLFEIIRKRDSTNYVLFIALLVSVSLIYVLFSYISFSGKKRETEEATRRFKEEQETLRKKLAEEHETNRRRLIEDNYRKISVTYAPNHRNIDNAYIVSGNVVSKAESAITIVADYSPLDEVLEVPPARQQYFLTIEEVLQEKILQERTDQQRIAKGQEKQFHGFKYIRFMQRDPQTFEEIYNKRTHTIDENKFIEGDEQAFAHCKRVIDIIKKNNGEVKFELYITKFVPSLPSILIVDNHKLLFTIPQRAEGKKVETAGVLEFTDNNQYGNAIVKHYYEIINTLKSENEEYVRITEISDALINKNNRFKKYYEENIRGISIQ